MPDPTWTSPTAAAAIAALASAIAAGIAAFNAREQRRIGQEKLKLDLFDRRFKIYEALCRYIAHAVQRADIDDDTLRDLDRNCASIEFLFGSDIRKYVATVRNKGIDLMTANKVMAPLPIGEDRSRQAAISSELLKWFCAQFAEAEVHFTPYLGFTRIRSE